MYLCRSTFDENDFKTTFNADLNKFMKTNDENKKVILRAYAQVLSPDVRLKLKEILSILELLQHRLMKGISHHTIDLSGKNFTDSMGLDAEAMVFISQNFTRTSVLGSLPSETKSLKRRSTILVESMISLFSPENTEVSFDAIEGTVDHALKGVGNNWNFDIWFVYNTWNKDITPMANFLWAKYNFPSILGYDKEIASRFFSIIE
jgi:hypothetical protein